MPWSPAHTPGVFTVAVDVATSRPPAAHATVFVHVAADSDVAAPEMAALMATCHPAVVMPVGTTIVSMVA